jgi:hypothetical protein
MPIMRGPSASNKTFKVPCSGEGIFVVVNLESKMGNLTYWNGTSAIVLSRGSLSISTITVQNGVATVIVINDSGYNSSLRVCFIPGDPLASN